MPDAVPVASSIFNRGYHAVLFDMDGTLIDSTAAVERSWARWANHWAVDTRFMLNGHGRPAAELVRDCVPEGDVTKALAHLLRIEAKDTDGVVTLPGVDRMLASLPRDRWAIVTSCTRSVAIARLSAAGLAVPPILVTFDDVQRGKPDPEPFQLAAQRMGLDATECLVVEDAIAGLIAGRSAGCTTLAVAGTHAALDLSPYADEILPSLEMIRFSAHSNAVFARSSSWRAIIFAAHISTEGVLSPCLIAPLRRWAARRIIIPAPRL
jgi:sugar-phosphatase